MAAPAEGVSLLREFAAGLFGVPKVAECLVIVSGAGVLPPKPGPSNTATPHKRQENP